MTEPRPTRRKRDDDDRNNTAAMNHNNMNNHQHQHQHQEAQRKAYLREALKNIKQQPPKDGATTASSGAGGAGAGDVSPHPPPGDRSEHALHAATLRPGPMRAASSTLQENKEKGLSAFKAMNHTFPGTAGHAGKTRGECVGGRCLWWTFDVV